MFGALLPNLRGGALRRRAGAITAGAIAVACLASAAPAAAEPGDLDPAFGKNGKKRLDIGADEGANAVAVDSQRRIVMAGSMEIKGASKFLIVRLRPNGALDKDFSRNGWTTVGFGEGGSAANAVAIQSDGRIAVVGNHFQGGRSPAIARLTNRGRLDQSFSDDGKRLLNLNDDFLDDSFEDVAVHEGGLVAVGYDDQDAVSGGNYDFVAVRFLNDGSSDEEFAGDGIAEISFADTTYSDDGAEGVTVEGTDVVLAGYMEQGSNVPSGTNDYDFGVARLTSTGVLDDTTTPFGGDGLVTVDFGTADDYADDVVGQGGDGKLVVGGWATLPGPFEAAAGLARLEDDGDLDPTFDGDGDADGKVQEDFGDDQFSIDHLALDSHQRIFGVGRFDDPPSELATAAFSSDGDVTDGWDGLPLPEGLATTDFGGRNDRGFGIAIQPQDRPVAVGSSGGAGEDSSDLAVARYQPLPAPPPTP